MNFDVTVRHIQEDGSWEEWVSSVDAPDRESALIENLRWGFGDYLLQPGRFRFRVTVSE